MFSAVLTVILLVSLVLSVLFVLFVLAVLIVLSLFRVLLVLVFLRVSVLVVHKITSFSFDANSLSPFGLYYACAKRIFQ